MAVQLTGACTAQVIGAYFMPLSLCFEWLTVLNERLAFYHGFAKFLLTRSGFRYFYPYEKILSHKPRTNHGKDKNQTVTCQKQEKEYINCVRMG